MTHKSLRLFGFLAICGLLADPVAADDLAAHWVAAQTKWNAIGDKAAAGDKTALARLEAEIDACKKDEVCTKLRPDAPSPAQVDAAGAAVNLGWLYHEGKLGDPDLERAMEFYTVAAQLGHPIGEHNVAELLETGMFVLDYPDEIKSFYDSASANGVAASAIALGRIYEKEQRTIPAANYYALAFRNKPTQKQRDFATQKLTAMGVSADTIAAAAAATRTIPKPVPAHAQGISLQSPEMPQTIPEFLAELQSLVLPNLTSENPENATRYTASQTLDADECRVTIRRTLKLSGEVNENIMRQTTFDFGDNYVILTDWRNEHGFSDILFRPLTYKEPFPSIFVVDLATPGGATRKIGAITIEFDDERKMVRAVELIHFLQQLCAKN